MAMLPPGVWVVDRMPHHYGENISLLAALGVAGVSTPMTVEGAVDTAVLHTDVERALGPTLKPGNIVVWNNLAVHKVAGIAESIESRGARLESLPPYSPELNPIEQCWAKLKTALRQACVRTPRRLDAALKRDLRTITPADAQAWFIHCGYPVYQSVIRYRLRLSGARSVEQPKTEHPHRVNRRLDAVA